MLGPHNQMFLTSFEDTSIMVEWVSLLVMKLRTVLMTKVFIFKNDTMIFREK